MVEMEHLIVNLSQISDDATRRKELLQIFEHELAVPFEKRNDPLGEKSSVSPLPFSSLPFVELWNQVLTVVGSRVKARAHEVNAEMQIQASSNSDSTNEVLPNLDNPVIHSPERQQLWALIDMMVQSKVIVKQYETQYKSQSA
jgi:hypothetical protein